VTRVKTRLLMASLIVPVAWTGVAVPAAGGQPAPDAAGPAPIAASVAPGATAPANSARITLITGDTLIYTDTGGEMPSIAVDLDPASGTREIDILRGPDGLYAIPDQAQPLIDRDVLDRELFDVEYLAENGYTDDAANTLPVIVTYDRAALRSEAAPLAARTDALPATAPGPLALPSINGAGVGIDKTAADSFWHEVTGNPSIDKVWLDQRTSASLDESRDQIGVPSAWRSGVDGTGTTVAVLDTGYDAGHPDLQGQVAQARSFVPNETAQDGHGHGTHVASTIAGTGAASDRRYAGVAPGADLLVGKVLGNAGWGQNSWIIAGMEWAAANADVVNMSLGSFPTNGKDPMSQAVDRITAETGTLFVISAGNTGSGARTVTAPATADSALAVAAVDPDDRIADFSSRGPRFGDGALKPEIAAPGSPVVAAWAAGTRTLGVPVGPQYQAIAGTSMASPHVAGVAAMLLQLHPGWDAGQLKNALMSTSHDAGLDPYQQGAGRVDAARATGQGVFATGKADLGTTPYPVPADPKRTTTLTYTNTGDRDLTLDLGIEVTDQGDVPAGAALALSADRVVVPAAGQADVELTLDPSRGAAGRFTGHVHGRGADGVEVRTTVAYVVESPAHKLTVELTGRDGGAAISGLVLLHDVNDPDRFYDVHGTDDAGRTVFAVPPGDYALQGVLRTGDSLGTGFYAATDVFSTEVLGVGSDRTVRIDGTRAADIKYEVRGEGRMIEPVQTTQALYRTTGNGARTSITMLGGRWDNNSPFGAIPGAAPTVGTLEATVLTTLREPLIRAELEPSGQRLFTVTPEWTGRFDGSKRLVVVDVGAGRPEDYAGVDVTGKVALVTSNESYVQAQAEAAAAAGAFAVLVARDAPGMIALAVDNDNTMPVVGTTYAEAVRLRGELARGSAWLRLTGVGESTFTYTLRNEENGAIPADLTYRVDRKDLAVMQNSFHSEAKRLGSGAVGVYEAWEGGAFQYLTHLVQPARRTDHVSAGGELRQRVELSSFWGFNEARLSGKETAYQPGQRYAVDWFKAPSHPSAHTDLPCNFCRSDYILRFAPNNVGDADPTHYGSGRPWPTYTTYRDGVLVEDPDLLLVPQPATYRIDRIAQAEPDAAHLLANRTETTWTFRSRAPTGLEIDGCRDLLPGANECAALPVILLGYTVPLGIDNAASAGRTFSFVVRTSRAKGYGGPARVEGVRVSASYDDGASWLAAPVERVRGAEDFRVELRHPRLAATSGFVSLRVEAWDNAGNRTTQTIERAYALR
jgi:subtilisin family serine protease